MNKTKWLYLSERKISNTGFSYSENIPKLKEYWETLLREQIVKDIEKVYDENFENLLNTDNANIKDMSKINEMEAFQKNLFNISENKERQKLQTWKKKFPFLNFLLHFVNYCINLADGALNQPLLENYLDSILTEIYTISVSTLIFEMNIEKQAKKLIGDTVEEETNYYNDVYLSDKNYIRRLFLEYPCLERMIYESIQSTTKKYLDMVWRISGSHQIIVKKLCDNKEFTSIIRLESKKSITIITLDNGFKIVYKPYSLKNEITYHKYVKYLSKDCKYQLKGYPIINCGNYGWERYVAKKDCKSKEEKERYFYRLGILHLADYLFGNDWKEKNVVASGEYPVIVSAKRAITNCRKYVNLENDKIFENFCGNTHILEGFTDAYNQVIQNKEEAKKQLAIFENLNIEYSIQNRQHYEVLLQTSYQPIFLRDARDRELYLCSSFENFEKVQGDIQVVKAEICDMLDRNIPYFYTNTSSRDLYTSKGCVIKNYFGKSALELVTDRILNGKKRDEVNDKYCAL